MVTNLKNLIFAVPVLRPSLGATLKTRASSSS
jgi:hypothetical protein